MTGLSVRQYRNQPCPVPVRLVDRERPAMGLGDELRQVNAETVAAGLTRTRRISAIERLAEVRDLVRREARAAILNHDHEVVIFPALRSREPSRPCRNNAAHC